MTAHKKIRVSRPNNHGISSKKSVIFQSLSLVENFKAFWLGDCRARAREKRAKAKVKAKARRERRNDPNIPNWLFPFCDCWTLLGYNCFLGMIHCLGIIVS